MRSLKIRAKSCLRKAISPHKSIPPRSGISHMGALGRLPVELLLSITDFLPSVDLICFSLCNHRLFELFLGPGANRLPLSTRYKRLSLLNRLERDLPKYLACDICTILHRYDGSESLHLRGFGFPTRWRSCIFIDTQQDKLLRLHSIQMPNQLSFLQLKLAMKRLQFGPKSGISTDSLSNTSVRCYSKAYNRTQMMWLFSVEAQACSHPLGLYIRAQDLVLVETRQELISQARCSGSGTFPWILEVCRHQPFIDLITPFVGSLHDGEEASFTYTCHICRTNAQFDIFEFDSKFAMTMTRWAYLGPGRTREDPLWKYHVNSTYIPSSRLHDKHDLSRHLPKAQKARLRFEESASQSFEELGSRNLCYLKDQKYKRTMRFNAKEGYWYIYIPYKDPSVNMVTRFLGFLLGRSKMSWRDEVFYQEWGRDRVRSSSSSDTTNRFLVGYMLDIV